MALTEYEKKILEQMEASLREEDPALAFKCPPSAVEDAKPSLPPVRRVASHWA